MQGAMRPLRDLSFRYKIPLRGAILVVVTAILLTGALIYREYRDIRQDLLSSSASMARVLAKTLVTPLVHDDVWRSYEIINAPFVGEGGASNPIIADFIVVLDRHGKIYIASHPARYPMLTDPGRANPDFNRFQEAIRAHKEFETRAVELDGTDTLYMVTPITADGVLLGSLIMGYAKHGFRPRFLGMAKSGALVAFLVVLLIIPASWYWAQRFADPLVSLADTMARAKGSIPDDADLRIAESGDEIGRLGSAFKGMLNGLREREALEKQVILSERLAALGRLAAAVAHEINNPLGGMLNALNTFKRHGSEDPLAARTFSLVERGLLQIQDTVSAMLVEVRQHSHDLTPQDIEDTRTLVLPDAQRKSVRCAWNNTIDRPLPLPATPVRQILINLLLNAVQAVEQDGRMGCDIAVADGRLRILVSNTGTYIPQEAMEVLFEPLSSQRENGHGLGLWVTYQLVRQLGGEISAESTPEETRFTVFLPVPGETAA
jgi:signal transduction histidine kinase